jgi:trehalose 6-phosphate synthase complex regulatory subunit
MSSLRNHRVVIASLFLPNTAVLGESAPSTPDHVTSLPEFKAAPPTTRSQPQRSGPLKSIVEDLKVG